MAQRGREESSLFAVSTAYQEAGRVQNSVIGLWTGVVYLLVVYMEGCDWQEGGTGLWSSLQLALLAVIAAELWQERDETRKKAIDWVLIATSAGQVSARLIGWGGIDVLKLAVAGRILITGYRGKKVPLKLQKVGKQLQNLLELPQIQQNPQISAYLIALLEAENSPKAFITANHHSEASKGSDPISPVLNSQELSIFSNVNSPEFNIFALKDLSHNRPLHALGRNLLFSLCKSLNIPLNLMNSLLIALEAAYYPLPYHSSTHAADVMQAVHSFVRGELTEREEMVLYLAAAAHDVGHPGRNNAFLVNTRSKLAVLYNDKAVLENHHVSTLFTLINNEKHAIFAKWSSAEYTQTRSTLINMILSTDISDHSRLLTALKSTPFPTSNPHQLRTLHLSFILHAGDISNPTRNWSLAHTWTQLILEECFLQGDEEKRLGLPIGPLNDRSLDVARSQVGFIEHLVQPTFAVLREVLPATEGLSETLTKNKEAWERRE